MWNTIQCAVQGRSHIKSNTPCQDKTYVFNNDDIQVIALADGAGSARLSHVGAEYVTKRICECISKEFDVYYKEDDGVVIKRKIVNYLLSELNVVAREKDCDIKDLASTLLVVAVKSDKYIIIHIGDGVIGYLKNDELNIASHPANGEFVNTTIFVTSGDVLQTMRILKGKLGEISGFALMSDGTETSFYSKKDRTLAPVLKKLMEFTKILSISCLENELKKSFEEVVKNNTTDDCSLALLVKENCLFRGYNFMTQKEKVEILGYKKKNYSKKIIHRYDEILNFLDTPKSLLSISKKICLRKKYTKKYLDYLIRINLIVKEGNCYRTAIILSK